MLGLLDKELHVGGWVVYAKYTRGGGLSLGPVLELVDSDEVGNFGTVKVGCARATWRRGVEGGYTYKVGKQSYNNPNRMCPIEVPAVVQELYDLCTTGQPTVEDYRLLSRIFDGHVNVLRDVER